MEASHGKEEKRQESGKEKDRPKEGETQRKGGQEGRNAGSNDGGIGGRSPFGSGDARRGENRPEPRSCMALSDGFQAISGLGVNCGQSGALVPRTEPRPQPQERGIGLGSCLM